MAPMLASWCNYKPPTSNNASQAPESVNESAVPSTSTTSEPQATTESQPTATASESKKASAFRKIIKKVKAGTGTENHKYCKKFVSFNEAHDRLDCQCGAHLWRGVRHRSDELFNHFKTCKLTTNHGDTSVLKKLVNGSKDMMLKPLNYMFLYATFVILYFIVYHQLSLHLLFAMNVTLSFLGITTAGGGYIRYVNKMVQSFYVVRFAEICGIIRQSMWWSVSFDESTSKTKREGYIAINIKYRDRLSHQYKSHCTTLQAITDGTADSLTGVIENHIKNELKLDPNRNASGTGDNCTTNTGSTKGVLTQLCALLKRRLNVQKRGHFVNEFISKCQKGDYSKHGMNWNEEDNAKLFAWLKHRYGELLPSLEQQINIYFPPKTMELCDTFHIFCPSDLQAVLKTKNTELIDQYGYEEIKRMCELMKRKNRIISPQDALNDWDIIVTEMKHELQINGQLTLSDFWEPRLEEYDVKLERMPGYYVLLLFDGSVCLLNNSAGNERVFKTMNSIKTPQRSRLGNDLLKWLVFLVLAGWESLAAIPFRKVIHTFNEMIHAKNARRPPNFTQIKEWKRKKNTQFDDTEHLSMNNPLDAYNRRRIEDERCITKKRHIELNQTMTEMMTADYDSDDYDDCGFMDTYYKSTTDAIDYLDLNGNNEWQLLPNI
eukprot:319061_1